MEMTMRHVKLCVVSCLVSHLHVTVCLIATLLCQCHMPIWICVLLVCPVSLSFADSECVNDLLGATIACSILLHKTITIARCMIFKRAQCCNIRHMFGMHLVYEHKAQPTCALLNVLQSRHQARTLSQLSARGLLSSGMLIKLHCDCIQHMLHDAL